MSTAVRQYVRSLELDAYVVGGAVRDELLGIPHKDEDFLVPDVDQVSLREALEPHGRVDNMEVHGQLVGVRFQPRDSAVRALVPSGIELAPARAERSTGPGHHDFAIVADGTVSIRADMERRDFTVNAMARRLSTGELIDPFGGVSALARRELRTVTPQSFRDDPLRMLRALRLVSQLGFDLAGETRVEMCQNAEGIRHVAPERIGGGLADDGLGELSRLLLGREPARALEIARDTGVLMVLLPEFSSAIGYDLGSPRQPYPLDGHILATVQAAADLDASLPVRLAALLHDLGKLTRDDGTSHAVEGARVAAAILDRLRYPVRLQRRVSAIVGAHTFSTEAELEPVRTRRFLATYGDETAFDLCALKEADLAAKIVPVEEIDALARFRKALERELSSPHRLADLAVDGDDLLQLGFREGPDVGEVLTRLLDEVLEDPARNDRALLLSRAREALT